MSTRVAVRLRKDYFQLHAGAKHGSVQQCCKSGLITTLNVDKSRSDKVDVADVANNNNNRLLHFGRLTKNDIENKICKA